MCICTIVSPSLQGRNADQGTVRLQQDTIILVALCDPSHSAPRLGLWWQRNQFVQIEMLMSQMPALFQCIVTSSAVSVGLRGNRPGRREMWRLSSSSVRSLHDRTVGNFGGSTGRNGLELLSWTRPVISWHPTFRKPYTPGLEPSHTIIRFGTRWKAHMRL
jgi:hypothetical protein